MARKNSISSKLSSVFFLICIFCCIFNFAQAAGDSVDVTQSVYFEEAPSTGGGGMLPVDSTPPEIYDVKIYDITYDSAKVSWKTDVVCLVELYYGKDSDFEFGPMTDHPDSYLDHHDFQLTGLGSGTTYYLKLVSRNQKGAEAVVTGYYFATAVEFTSPDNVGSVDIETGVADDEVVINWQNPDDEDFAGVQINKSTDHFVTDPSDGEVVFNGLAETFTDSEVEDGSEYFYTIFSYDQYGNFSSGVAGHIYVDFGSGGSDDDGVGDGGDDGSDDREEENVPDDVEDIMIVPDPENGEITIRWKNPDGLSDYQIEIRRGTDFPPLTPYEGELVYKGSGDSFVDSGLEDDMIYYYSVFVQDKDGVYSSGKIVASSLKGEVGVDLKEEWKRIGFFDADSGIEFSSGNEGIKTFTSRNIGVSYDIDILPEEVKAIAVEMNGSLYLLDYDEIDGFYKTSFMSPDEQGSFKADVIFLDFQDDVLFRKEINLEVVGLGTVYESKWKNFSDDGFSSETMGCYLKRLAGKYSSDCVQEVAIEGAEISIFRENSSGGWELWNADLFSQQNPYFSSEKGEFGFIIENGRYKIVVKKDGFEDKIVTVDIVDNLIKNNIEIIRQKYWFYAIITAVILFVLVAIRLRKKIFK